MSRTPAVSVITLTHQHGALLAQCLDSVREQTFEDWEQIVLDDGSSDGSVEAVESALDPRVRIVRRGHRGVDAIPASYCHALSLARGRTVAFVDGDDLWTPWALESGVAALRDPDAVLAWGRTEIFGARVGLQPAPHVLERFPMAVLENVPLGSAARAFADPDVAMPFSMIASLLRREALDRIGGLQVRPGLPVMDHPTLLRLTVEGRFRHTGAVTARQRAAASTVSQRERPRIDLGVYREIRSFRRRFGRRLPITGPQWRDVDARWRRRIARHSTGHALLRLSRSGRWDVALVLASWLARSPWLWRHELAALVRVVRRELGRDRTAATSPSGPPRPPAPPAPAPGPRAGAG